MAFVMNIPNLLRPSLALPAVSPSRVGALALWAAGWGCSAEGVGALREELPDEAGGGAGAGEVPQSALAELEAGEWLPGGSGTNTRLLGRHAFTFPLLGLDDATETSFFTGDSAFNQNWVAVGNSTLGRDGLGPTFNARACSTCHVRDGRGAPPTEERDSAALLLRLSMPGSDALGRPLPVPHYGGQLQTKAIEVAVDDTADFPPLLPEGAVGIELRSVEGAYGDGEPFTLQAPRYRIEAPAYGPLPDTMLISPRVAPVVIGLGLLENIPAARIEALADPDDADGDGISGRINWVWDEIGQELAMGRFGWKANQPSLAQQNAAAFLGDIGITTAVFAQSNCPEGQTACSAQPTGSETRDDSTPEVDDQTLEDVLIYTQTLAPPVRRGWDEERVLRGKKLFAETGCAACHTPSHQTSPSAIAPLGEERIWPYTDLLLHDMGEDLSDGRPLFAASAREWRTPPLWGIGRVSDVNDHQRFLHDGRARGFAEAILWHGGEAEAAREHFRTLPREDREALLRFLQSL